MALWNILQTFGILCDNLVHFVFIWFIFSGFGIMYQEKNLATLGVRQGTILARQKFQLLRFWVGIQKPGTAVMIF
jgi:hypothetical protein